ncbi:hypothetical protein PMIN03_007522 [Paraphaeosphaeria minitans]
MYSVHAKHVSSRAASVTLHVHTSRHRQDLPLVTEVGRPLTHENLLISSSPSPSSAKRGDGLLVAASTVSCDLHQAGVSARKVRFGAEGSFLCPANTPQTRLAPGKAIDVGHKGLESR